jgi:putative hydrolase of HD superfamily
MDDLSELYKIIFKLKNTKRQGWLDRNLNSDTIAAHSLGAAIIGWRIADKEKVDPAKIAEFLIIHDLVMVFMEDVTPTGGKYLTKRKLEEKAKHTIAEAFNPKYHDKYLQLFDEYNLQQSLESKVARDADKLDTLLQAESYEIETGRNDILDEFLTTYQDVMKTEAGKNIFQQIKNRHQKRK